MKNFLNAIKRKVRQIALSSPLSQQLKNMPLREDWSNKIIVPKPPRPTIPKMPLPAPSPQTDEEAKKWFFGTGRKPFSVRLNPTPIPTPPGGFRRKTILGLEREPLREESGKIWGSREPVSAEFLSIKRRLSKYRKPINYR
jgi:hypothetical protein